MHIFFDDQIFHTQVYGGISRYITGLAAALKSQNLALPYVFGGYSRNQNLFQFNCKYPNQTIYLPRYDNLRINSFFKKSSAIWRRLTSYKLQNHSKNFIYHPSFYEIDTFVKKRAMATVITVHDMIAELFPTHSKHSSRHIHQKRIAITQADHIFTVSESTRTDLLHFFPEISKEKITITPLGSTLVVPPTPPLRIHQRPYFLHVGQRSGYKNGKTLIDAFIRSKIALSETDLILCGPALTSEEREIIANHHHQRHIIHLDTNDRDLQSLYAHAKALVFPSAYEGFGLPVLEAQSLGCPVITCPVSSLPEVAGDAALYTPAGNVKALSQALISLLEDEELRSRLSRLGLIQAAKYSWNHTARLTMQGYISSITPD
jgi:glycosyltransferase involved in cell wall biosynthesis